MPGLQVLSCAMCFDGHCAIVRRNVWDLLSCPIGGESLLSELVEKSSMLAPDDGGTVRLSYEGDCRANEIVVYPYRAHWREGPAPYCVPGRPGSDQILVCAIPRLSPASYQQGAILPFSRSTQHTTDLAMPLCSGIQPEVVRDSIRPDPLVIEAAEELSSVARHGESIFDLFSTGRAPRVFQGTKGLTNFRGQGQRLFAHIDRGRGRDFLRSHNARS